MLRAGDAADGNAVGLTTSLTKYCSVGNGPAEMGVTPEVDEVGVG